MITRRTALSFIATTSLLPATAGAQTAPSTPMLKMKGRIAKPVSFDRDALLALGTHGFETMTPWYTNKARFEGVRMSGLLTAVGATGEKIVVTALNDYTTEIPVSDFATYEVILAMKRDGQLMPVTDKGPFFIIYNFDSNSELKSKKFYARSAWQVATIEVV